MFRDRHDIVAIDHQALAGAFAVAAAFLQHRGEFQPAFFGRVLAAEFAFAMAPAAGGDHAGEPVIDPAGIDRDRRAEAGSQYADALGIDLGPGLQIIHRGAGVLHLFLTDDAAEIAFRLAAAPHIEPEGGVAPTVQHLAGAAYIAGFLVGTEPVQHDNAGQAGCVRAFRCVQDARKRHIAGRECDFVFHRGLPENSLLSYRGRAKGSATRRTGRGRAARPECAANEISGE